MITTMYVVGGALCLAGFFRLCLDETPQPNWGLSGMGLIADGGLIVVLAAAAG